MSATPSNQDEQAAEVTLILETTDDQGCGCYGLARFYRRGADTIRVRFHRDEGRLQSWGTADVLTSPRDWLRIVDNPPSNWHDKTFVWGLPSNPRLSTEDGLRVLRELADDLAAKAALIVSD